MADDYGNITDHKPQTERVSVASWYTGRGRHQPLLMAATLYIYNHRINKEMWPIFMFQLILQLIYIGHISACFH